MNSPLISRDYLELQRELHSRGGYGKGVSLDDCLGAMMRHLPFQGGPFRGGLKPWGNISLLDYGCGPGVLGQRLINSDGVPCVDLREYDPAIPGKDELPEPADVVICADVMEHVEEDRVDTVLAHIAALTRKIAVFAIATRPSAKIMADGRQAHITLHDFDWWRSRLERVLAVEEAADRDAEGRGLLFVCRPYKRTVLNGEGFVEVGRIEAVCAVEEEVRNEQLEANCRRIKARVAPDMAEACMPVHDRSAALVCYGPSLADTWHMISHAQSDGVEVFTASGAHAFLAERGIIPYAHLECDPRPHKAEMLGDPIPGVRYWLASCVAPELVEKVAAHDVALWHAYNGPSSHELISRLEPGQRIIVSGGSIGLRAIALLYFLGYRDIAVFGMDCSFKDGEQHAGAHTGKAMEPVEVMCGGRKFQTSLALITYFRFFMKQLKFTPDLHLNMIGDGLLQHALKVGQ